MFTEKQIKNQKDWEVYSINNVLSGLLKLTNVEEFQLKLERRFIKIQNKKSYEFNIIEECIKQSELWLSHNLIKEAHMSFLYSKIINNLSEKFMIIKDLANEIAIGLSILKESNSIRKGECLEYNTNLTISKISNVKERHKEKFASKINDLHTIIVLRFFVEEFYQKNILIRE